MRTELLNCPRLSLAGEADPLHQICRAHRYRRLISILRRDEPIICKEASFVQSPFVYSELFLKLGTPYAPASGSVPPEPF
jgi:hypothetical protein